MTDSQVIIHDEEKRGGSEQYSLILEKIAL